jgi:two-component system, sensor histidine kinase and response regulator
LQHEPRRQESSICALNKFLKLTYVDGSDLMDGDSRAPRPAVLIVDDVEANLLAVEALLVDMNCDVVLSRSGEHALRQLLRRDFAVVLLDVQMPGMDGYEVSRLVRGNPATRDVPIIFLTAGNESEQTALRGYGSGGVDVLFKPVNPAFVRDKVAIFLELWLSRRQIADAKAELERSNRALEAFSYSVSHDLRAPLRSIDGFAQSLIEDHAASLDERGLGDLRRVRAAARRMALLIDDLLLLSQVSRRTVHRSRFDLSAAARAIAAELGQKQTQHQVWFSVQPELLLDADPGLMRILLENLLGNAWKFTSKTPEPRVEVGALQENGSVVYFVKDNGAGFNMTYANQLFAPFRRLHREADFPGTGIGLATVQRIVEHHGGRAWAQGAVGQGATIYFTVPAQAELGTVNGKPTVRSHYDEA